MKLNDFISEYHELIDNPNEVLEFFKLASDYLNPDTYNQLCKMLRDAGVKFDWQGIINQTNYIIDYKEIPSNINNNLSIDNFIAFNFKPLLDRYKKDIRPFKITFTGWNDFLHVRSEIAGQNIDGEIEDPQAIIDEFFFSIMIDNNYGECSLYIFFTDTSRSNFINIGIPIKNVEQNIGEDILTIIPYQAILYNSRNLKIILDNILNTTANLLQIYLDSREQETK